MSHPGCMRAGVHQSGLGQPERLCSLVHRSLPPPRPCPQVLAGGARAGNAAIWFLKQGADVVSEWGAEVVAVGKDLPMVGAAFGLMHMIVCRAQTTQVRGALAS